MDQPVDDHVRAQLERLRASGATLHFTHTKARTVAAAPWLLARHRLPYVLPAGGSSPVGALGYVEGALELAEQVREGVLPEPSHVVCAVGSGGTAAGLLLGLRIAGLRTKVLGVVVNDKLKLDHATLMKLAAQVGAAAARPRRRDVPDPDPAQLDRDPGLPRRRLWPPDPGVRGRARARGGRPRARPRLHREGDGAARWRSRAPGRCCSYTLTARGSWPAAGGRAARGR